MWLWWIPIALLAVALFPMPYGYYVFLRLALFISAGIVAYTLYQNDAAIKFWTILFVLIALLYNPIFRVHLTREIWSVLNVLTAAIYAGHWFLVVRPQENERA